MSAAKAFQPFNSHHSSSSLNVKGDKKNLPKCAAYNLLSKNEENGNKNADILYRNTELFIHNLCQILGGWAKAWTRT